MKYAWISWIKSFVDIDKLLWDNTSDQLSYHLLQEQLFRPSRRADEMILTIS